MIPKKLFSRYCREVAHMNSVIVTVVRRPTQTQAGQNHSTEMEDENKIPSLVKELLVNYR